MTTIQKIISLYFIGTCTPNAASGSPGGASTMTAFARQQNIRWPDAQRPLPTRENSRDPSEFKEIPMKFRPLHDRVVVKRIDAEAKSAGGIIIPDTAQEKPSQGEVTAIGPGGRDEAGKLIPIDLRVGDRVLFGKWSGTEVKIDDVELLIMKESDIMGVLDEPVAKKKAA
jgi:chaperonin GroES